MPLPQWFTLFQQLYMLSSSEGFKIHFLLVLKDTRHVNISEASFVDIETPQVPFTCLLVHWRSVFFKIEAVLLDSHNKDTTLLSDFYKIILDII